MAKSVRRAGRSTRMAMRLPMNPGTKETFYTPPLHQHVSPVHHHYTRHTPLHESPCLGWAEGQAIMKGGGRDSKALSSALTLTLLLLRLRRPCGSYMPCSNPVRLIRGVAAGRCPSGKAQVRRRAAE
ncbi:hypothetical protein E2C01_005974 [Portunus trituberculatus]|uniref:Uncharacterized protein n=1 Tax=Portunus trituberculatus TaxID=210409 RepID=A0A5B7CTS1_PORTR|nr:hypothetical protein [Portunus trituberculatus]